MAQDFGTPLPPEIPAKKNNTLWIVLGIVAGVLVLCCCCAVVGYLVYNSMYPYGYY